MFRLLLIALVLLISGCGGICIEPGKGVSSSSIEVKVPVQPPGASRENPATYWINSGHRVEKDRELKLTVENTISLCPKDASTPAIVRMFPEDFVSSTRPQHEFYDTLLNVVEGDRVAFYPFLYDLEFPSCEKIGNEESFVIYYGNSDFYKDKACKLGIDAKDICSSGAYGGSAALYYKTPKNGAGGQCTDVHKDITLPKLGGNSVQTPRLAFPLGYLSKITKTTEHGKEVLQSNSKYMIATGRVYDGRTVKINGPPEITDGLCKKLKEGNITRVIEGRSLVELKQNKNPGKYDNKNKNSSGNGSSGNQSATITEEQKEQDALLREYTEYDINCNCGLICKPSDLANKEDCTRSIVRVMNDKVVCPTTKPKKVPEGDKAIEIDDSSLDALKDYLDFTLPDKDIGDSAYELAEGAIAVIKTTKNGQDNKDIATNDCNKDCKFLPEEVKSLSSAGEFSKHSLKMHKSYEVPESGRLFLSYIKPSSNTGGTGNTNNEESMQGFYTLKVHRTCYATAGKKLYMYIGKEAPKFLPGEGSTGGGNDVVALDLEGNSVDPKGIYVINKKGTDGSPAANGKEGYLYFGIAVDKEYDEQLKDGNYPDNYYSVRLWVTTWNPTISKFFALLQGTLLKILYGTEMSTTQGDANVDEVADISSAVEKSFKEDKKGAIQQIYSNQVSGRFWMFIQGVLTLYLMFSALGYIMGVTKITKYDLVVRLAKVTLLVCMFSQDSWKFFNEHCFSVFIGGVSDIIAAFNGYLDGDKSFKFLDATLGLLLTSELWIRLLALIAAGPVGWLAFVGIIWALIEFFLAMFQAMIAYLFSIMTVAFLITLAPIFFSFILFQRTRQLFDGWLKIIMNFSLQPIIMFASLAFLNQMILTSLHAVTDFTACESCAIGVNIPSDDPGTPNRPDLCLLPVMLPIGFSNELSVDDRYREGLAREDVGFMGLPFGLAIAIMLILCCKSVREFVKISETLAHSISGSVSSITASAMGATQGMLGVVGMDAASQQLIAAAKGMVPPGEEKVQFENRDGVRPMQEGVDQSKSPESDGDGTAARAAVGQGVDDPTPGPEAESGASAAGAGHEGHDDVSGDRGLRVGVPDVANLDGPGESPLVDDQPNDMAQAATSGDDGGVGRHGVPDDVGVAHYEEVGADMPVGPEGEGHEGDPHGVDMIGDAGDDAQSRLSTGSGFDVQPEWEDVSSPTANEDGAYVAGETGDPHESPVGETGAADSEESGQSARGGAHHEDTLDDHAGPIAHDVGSSDGDDSGVSADEVGRTDTTTHAASDAGQDELQRPEEGPAAEDYAQAVSSADSGQESSSSDRETPPQEHRAEFVDHLSGIEEGGDPAGQRADIVEDPAGGAADNYDNTDGEVIEEKLNKNPDNDTPAEEKQDKE
ncbi:putative plasmid conjugal transfer protein [Anaplasma centrale str. Israel]|uniref:Putative plasmid conjugal transfer protein n=1 Tax=Anaplasma centrale (strain Israel) TaxID=574556 RepID=D1AUB2_ANACI|nr:type IV secretion system protein [Anaplasma centrale]ACZ49140.1 putative plasmid conjugal transfer protein [Anaplasma centrale str. Israel]